MAAHQFTESIGVLLRHHPGNQFIVANPWCPLIAIRFYDSSFLVIQNMSR